MSILEDRQHSLNLEKEYVGKFQKYDLNGDGFISEEELIEGMDHLDSTPCDSNELKRLMKMVNKDENGALNYNDFVKILRYKGILE